MYSGSSAVKKVYIGYRFLKPGTWNLVPFNPSLYFKMTTDNFKKRGNFAKQGKKRVSGQKVKKRGK